MGYIALLLLFVPSLLWASPAEEPESSNVEILDTAQDLFGTRANFVANNIDSFFANQRADDELGRSNLRVRTLYEIRDRTIAKKDTQIRFNLRLPELEEKFHVRYVGIDGKESPEFLAKLKKKKDRNRIRIIKKPSPETKWLFRSDAGLNVNIPPNVFARSRLRKTFLTGTLINRFVGQLAWFSNSGVAQNFDLSTDHIFSDTLLFRFSNTQDWDISHKGFTTGHGPNLLHRVTDNDAFAYGINMSTIVTKSVWYVANYRISVDYRRNIYRNWIFLDITPGLDFPKSFSFRRNPFILVQLEALFGFSK